MERKILQSLRDRIQSGQCVLFLGAGATRDAKGPTGEELALILANHFGQTEIPTHDLGQFADILTGLPGIDREDLDSKIVEVLKRLEPSTGHYTVPTLPWRAIFTTNYDRLIEIAYDNVHGATGVNAIQDLQVAISSDQQASVSDRTKVTLFKLHGCISSIDKRNPLVLTPKDFSTTRKKRSKMLRLLKSLAKEHAFVFVGYSFSDGVVSPLLEELENESAYHSRRLMYLVSPCLSSTEQAFFESRNFACISQTFSEFLEEVSSYFEGEAKKNALGRRLAPIASPKGGVVSLPPKLRVSLEAQVEFLGADTYPQEDARPFLHGLPPTVGDLKNRNDIERQQEEHLLNVLTEQLGKEDYIRPLVVVLGPGGAGKSTLALRCAYEIAEKTNTLVFRLKSSDLWKREEIIELATRVGEPVLFVCDNIEVHSTFKALRDLRVDLSASRTRSLLLASCQKAVWNELARLYPQQEAVTVTLKDNLTEDEARDLIHKLASHNILELDSGKGLAKQLHTVLDKCEGSLVVAMLELVKSGKFRDIVLSEYENLSKRAKDAYEYVALVHQHRRSMPDYLLNDLTVKDWNVFTDEVIRLESELILVQDLDYSAGRICFRTRHPEIARVVIDAVVFKHEDRIRMYRRIIRGLGSSEEDRSFLLGLLTSRSVRDDIGDRKYVEEFLNLALDLFPSDTIFILHLGKFEIQIGNLDRAHEIIKWGLSIDSGDSYLIHQLAICEERLAEANESIVVREAHFQEAQRLYNEKQLRDPQSHYGYSSEARMHLKRAKDEVDARRKLDLISAALDAVRRGKDIVREDDRGILRELDSEIAFMLGNKVGLAAQLEQMGKDGHIRYASTYHLIAVCRHQEGEVDLAFAALEKGLSEFPGDPRLTNMMLELLEEGFSQAEVRKRSESFLSSRLIKEGNIRGLFLKSVLLYYNNNFLQSRQVFEELRQRMNRKASAKIRFYFCRDDGTTAERKGAIRTGSRGRIYIIDQESGERIPVDNREKWAALGNPTSVFFELGFSLAGSRAMIISPLFST